jgi:hypothetical protein
LGATLEVQDIRISIPHGVVAAGLYRLLDSGNRNASLFVNTIITGAMPAWHPFGKESCNMRTAWSAIIIVSLAVLAASAQTVSEEDRAAIVKTGLDYGDGFYAGDAVRMERALHADLNKVVVVPFPQTRSYRLSYSTVSGLIEMARAKAGYLEEEKRKAKVTVLEVNGDVACAKLNSAQCNDYLQMVKVDGEWKIVNVLWTLGPDAPNRLPLTGFDPAGEKPAIQKTALDFIEGMLGGEVERVERAIHPEASRAVFTAIPTTGKKMISRNRYSGLVEPIRARINVAPEGMRKADVRILDIMDGMAFVEAMNPSSVNYLQMAWMDGNWKIINILSKPVPAPAQKK